MGSKRKGNTLTKNIANALRSELVTLLDTLVLRDFATKKARLLNWVLFYDLWEASGLSKNEYVKILVEKQVISSVSQGNNNLSDIEWALEYDDNFGFTGDYENAQLVGEFTSMGEIYALRNSERAKVSKKVTKSEAEVALATAKRLAKGKTKKQIRALIVELEKLAK